MKLEWLTSNNPQQAFLYIMRMKTVNILRLKKKNQMSRILREMLMQCITILTKRSSTRVVKDDVSKCVP